MAPKVFISYSWTSLAFQAAVKQWAERLLADGVDVVLDIFELKEGHDKFAFMERMVTDTSVTHVLMMCDRAYAEKADARKAGVGTESQIISKEVYEKVDQSKFLPLVCEVDDKGNPYLPTFLKSRIWIDFSNDEAANKNWEQLVRVLHGRPLHVKPALGKVPTYLQDDPGIASPAITKFSTLRQAILDGKPAVALYRQEFLDSCIAYADKLRVRQKPQTENLGAQVLSDCGKLISVRDHIVDWVLLEAPVDSSARFQSTLIQFLERLLEVKARPAELNPWSDAWLEAHRLFVYETFLYIVAALLRSDAYQVLHEVFTSHYLQPDGAEYYVAGEFVSFDCFWTQSETLQILAADGRRLLSPAAELIKCQANRADISFELVMEAELLSLLMVFISPSANRWYPGTLHYASHKSFPFFVRATQHKGFEKLAIVTGIHDADRLRKAATEGANRLGAERWHAFWRRGQAFSEQMNLTKLNSIK